MRLERGEYLRLLMTKWIPMKMRSWGVVSQHTIDTMVAMLSMCKVRVSDGATHDDNGSFHTTSVTHSRMCTASTN
jgi:hypothetical protein